MSVHVTVPADPAPAGFGPSHHPFLRPRGGEPGPGHRRAAAGHPHGRRRGPPGRPRPRLPAECTRTSTTSFSSTTRRSNTTSPRRARSARAAAAHRRLLHDGIRDRVGRPVQSVDGPGDRSGRRAARLGPLRHEPACNRRGAHLVDCLPPGPDRRRWPRSALTRPAGTAGRSGRPFRTISKRPTSSANCRPSTRGPNIPRPRSPSSATDSRGRSCPTPSTRSGAWSRRLRAGRRNQTTPCSR